MTMWPAVQTRLRPIGEATGHQNPDKLWGVRVPLTGLSAARKTSPNELGRSFLRWPRRQRVRLCAVSKNQIPSAPPDDATFRQGCDYLLVSERTIPLAHALRRRAAGDRILHAQRKAENPVVGAPRLPPTPPRRWSPVGLASRWQAEAWPPAQSRPS
jgi:hypothetical protein